MSDKQQHIPYGWVLEKLGDVMDIKGGSQPPKSEFIYEPQEGYIQLLQIRDFGKKPVPTYVPENRVTKFCDLEDVLIARYGASLGRIVTGKVGAYNVALAKTIFDDRLFFGRYIFFLLQTSVLQTPLKMISRSAQNGFAKHEIAHAKLPIPPLNEQKRIVAKIEELFSALDNGIESLKTARAQLKLYRHAVLKHAFEGKLTEGWREENIDKLEPADELLKCIKQEREQRYQQQLEDWHSAVKIWDANGKEGKKPAKPAKLKAMEHLQADELSTLSNLPANWSWVKYGDLCSVVRNGISKKPTGETGDKIFRISAVRPLFFNMEDYRIIDNSSGKFNNYYLRKHDLVFTRYNGSRRYVGVCAEYNSDEDRLFPDKLVQTRPDLPSVISSYIEKAVNSGNSRKFVESKIRTTAGQ